MQLIPFLMMLSMFSGVKGPLKKQSYKFVVADHPPTDSANLFYYGMNFEFGYTRIYNEDGSFQELGLLEGTDGKAATFKVVKGVWYIKEGKRWTVFFTPRKKTVPKLTIAGHWHFLEPKSWQILNGVFCVVYRSSLYNGYSSHCSRYWFSPIHGIIKIEGSEVDLIREDIENRKDQEK